MPDLADYEIYYYAIPLNARFRGITVREGVIIRGDKGWGEFCPFDNYSDLIATRWLRTAIETATTDFPPLVRTQVPVNAIIPATTPQDAYKRVKESECFTVKVKVCDNSSTLNDDVQRLQAVRQALGAEGKIRIDVNGLWTPSQAIAQLPILIDAAQGLDYVEQPSNSADDLRRIKESIDVRISADELIRLAPDPFSLHLAGIADIAVIKVTPLNGISYCQKLVDWLNMPIVVSSALETSIGLQPQLVFAGMLSRLEGACGFGTLSLLEGDLTHTPLSPHHGYTQIHRVEADPELLMLYRNPDPDRVAWWKSRLIRCFDLLNLADPPTIARW